MKNLIKEILKESEFDWIEDIPSELPSVGQKFVVNKHSTIHYKTGGHYSPFEGEEEIFIIITNVDDNYIYYDSVHPHNPSEDASDEVSHEWYKDMMGSYWFPIDDKINESEFEWTNSVPTPGQYTIEDLEDLILSKKLRIGYKVRLIGHAKDVNLVFNTIGTISDVYETNSIYIEPRYNEYGRIENDYDEFEYGAKVLLDGVDGFDMYEYEINDTFADQDDLTFDIISDLKESEFDWTSEADITPNYQGHPQGVVHLKSHDEIKEFFDLVSTYGIVGKRKNELEKTKNDFHNAYDQLLDRVESDDWDGYDDWVPSISASFFISKNDPTKYDTGYWDYDVEEDAVEDWLVNEGCEHEVIDCDNWKVYENISQLRTLFKDYTGEVLHKTKSGKPLNVGDKVKVIDPHSEQYGVTLEIEYLVGGDGYEGSGGAFQSIEYDTLYFSGHEVEHI